MMTEARQRITAVLFAIFAISSVAADKAEIWQRADEIDYVTWTMETSEPPNLTIFVTGRFSKEGFFSGKLTRADYDEPPKDGIQDFYLLIQPDKGFVFSDDPKTKTNVCASANWKHCTADAPWLKGIRVHSTKGSVLKSVATQ